MNPLLQGEDEQLHLVLVVDATDTNGNTYASFAEAAEAVTDENEVWVLLEADPGVSALQLLPCERLGLLEGQDCAEAAPRHLREVRAVAPPATLVGERSCDS